MTEESKNFGDEAKETLNEAKEAAGEFASVGKVDAAAAARPTEFVSLSRESERLSGQNGIGIPVALSEVL